MKSHSNSKNGVLSNALWALAAGALSIAVLVFFNRLAAPPPKLPAAGGARDPDYARVLSEITPRTMLSDLETIAGAGSRFTGSPGAEQTADAIATELRELGYEVFEQPFTVCVPVTHWAEMIIKDPEKGEDRTLKIFPMLPNWFRTPTTPPEGLTGKLVVGKLGLAREFEGQDIEGAIVALPMGRPWQTVAAMGAAAVIYFDEEDHGADLGQNWGHSLTASVNVPRFLVDDDISALIGRTVCVRARVDIEQITARNIIGILPGPSNAKELLMLGCHYDAYSYLPDRAPGVSQACGLVSWLAAVRRLAGEKDNLGRHVMVAATAAQGHGLEGARALARIIGGKERRAETLKQLRNTLDSRETKLELARSASQTASDPNYWAAAGTAADDEYWKSRTSEERAEFEELLTRVINKNLMTQLDKESVAQVNWFRAGMPVVDDAGGEASLFTRYNEIRLAGRRLLQLIRTPPGSAKEHPLFMDLNMPERTSNEISTEIAHAGKLMDIARSNLELAERIPDHQHMLYLGFDLTPAEGSVAMFCGITDLALRTVPADLEIFNQVTEAGYGLDKTAGTPEEQIYVQKADGSRSSVNLVRNGDESRLAFSHGNSMLYHTSQPFLWTGHSAFMFATMEDNRKLMGTPFDTLERLLANLSKEEEGEEEPLAIFAQNTRLATASALRLACGFGILLPVQLSDETHTLQGMVVSRIGDDLTPSQTMPGALVRLASPDRWGTPIAPLPGCGFDLWKIADEKGRFEYGLVWGPALSTGWRSPISLDAAVVSADKGVIEWTLNESDSGPAAQFSVRMVEIDNMAKSLAMPVVFRAQAVEMVPMTDPSTLRPYAATGIIESKAMATPKDYKQETVPDLRVFFVPPYSTLYFTFRKGSFRNPNLTSVRAFALGAKGSPDGAHLEGRPDIWGEGYLAADNPRIRNIEIDAAVSMCQVNNRRLKLLQQHDMADAMTVAFHDKAIEETEAAQKLMEKRNVVAARHKAQDAIAYAQNVHPVLRETISDAVVGILFYLILAAPFAIFAEKLFFGHPDIRWQLGIQSGFFLCFFFALRFLHPAYQLVRSSFMILLGFATFALAAFVATFVSARFKQNLSELRKQVRDEASVADVSRGGAAAAAFVLGLGHMRRRKVRTGLTVATLILTTFVMLAFTSVQTDMVEIDFALGKAPYTGMLVRDANFNNMITSIAPLQERYGREHIVAPRRWVGTFQIGANKSAQRSIMDVTRVAGERRLRVEVNAALGLSVDEPKLTGVTNAFNVISRWFEDDREYSCFLPDTVAGALQITPRDIMNGEATVKFSGQDYQVLGTFDPRALEMIMDVDGQSLLPVDVLALMNPALQNQAANDDATEVPPDVDRLPGDVVVITPQEATPGIVASVAVGFRDLDYREARGLIVSHLERSGEPAFYGLDGVAYYGGRFRSRSLSGLLDLVIPLIVAGLAVLNTMRGSVYERRDELFVFNAVGLSPSHIMALFLAEASVYAVMGAVGGYLLAQGTTALLNAFNLTGGLTMNYASLSSIGVTLAVMACVFISSLFPARMASRLAAPAETLVRKRATAEGDLIEMDLPFMFNRRDRIALVAYFTDWFEDFGEGSSGAFICDPPTCGARADGDPDHAAPFVRTTVWLKPYDLGVSQRVEVTSRRAPDGKGIVATVTMTRLSGDLSSWERCCHSFVGLLRKRFLTWRAIPDDMRERLMTRGRLALEEALAQDLKG